MSEVSNEPTRPIPATPAPAPPAAVVGMSAPAAPPAAQAGARTPIQDQFAAWPDAAQERPDAGPPLLPGRPDDGARRAPAWPIVVVALLLVGGLIWAFSALRGGDSLAAPKSPGTAVAGSTTTPTTPSSTTSTGADPDAQAARVAVSEILDAGRGSRSTLVQGITSYCTKGDKATGKTQMDDALQGRMAQLAKLNDIGDEPFRKLPSALDARDKLKAALQASAAADQVYVQMAAAGTVCQGDDGLTQANAKASAAKKSFLDAWNPLMTAAKLQPLASDDI